METSKLTLASRVTLAGGGVTLFTRKGTHFFIIQINSFSIPGCLFQFHYTV